jgi:hypothetical protein
MSEDPARMPEYDPEAAGLPDTYDPDSTAYDEDESVREADGDPVEWPDRPVAIDRFGNTAEEARQGESLNMRLAEEEPDFGAEAEWPEDRLRGDLGVEDEFDLDGEEPGDPVGRIADADDDGSGGRHNETVAMDAGFAGGGYTAEESAMHLVDDEDMAIEDDDDLDNDE